MILVPQSKYAASLRSRLLFSWRGDPVAGLDALSGQAATYARTVGATGLDAAGNSYIAVQGQPCWRWTGGRPGLSLGTATGTAFTFPALFLPQALTVYLAAVDFHAGVLCSIGSSVFSVNSFTIGRPNGDNGFVYTRYNNGSTLRESIVAQAASGAEVEVRAVLYADGSSQIGLSVAGGTEAVGTRSTASSLGTSWSGSLIRLHPSTGSHDLRRVKVAAGVRTLDQMRGLL